VIEPRPARATGDHDGFTRLADDAVISSGFRGGASRTSRRNPLALSASLPLGARGASAAMAGAGARAAAVAGADQTPYGTTAAPTMASTPNSTANSHRRAESVPAIPITARTSPGTLVLSATP
jgi:hypothetical protein